MKKLLFLFAFILFPCSGSDDIPEGCYDEEVIDLEYASNCYKDSVPICGCDGNTYVNYCIAYHSYGITNYEYGACE